MNTVVHANPYYQISQEPYQLPNGEPGVYYGIRGLETVIVVPVLTDTQVVMVNQFRYLFNEYVLEFPAGRMEADEQPEQAAARELQEETGYQAGALVGAGWFAPCNGLSDERCHVFIARQLTLTVQQLDITEDMTVRLVERAALEDLIRSQQIHDGMTLAAWQLTQHVM